MAKKITNRNKLGRFVKGHKPWNKGTKGICKPNSGSFKKGQVSPKKGLTYEEIYGIRRAKEIRKRFSLTRKGRKLKEETKEKIRVALKGRRMSEKTKKKLEKYRSQQRKLKYGNVRLDKTTKSILVGTLLGDGYLNKLRKGGKGNSHLGIQHSIKQKEYLLWKRKFFEKFGADYKERISKKHKIRNEFIKETKRCGFRTKSFPIFTRFRKLFYPKGIKVINKKILKMVDKLALAVWFIDDGSYSKRNKKSSLMTQGFTYKENLLLQRWFKKRWKIECLMSPVKGKYVLVFTQKPTKQLIKIIRLHVLKMPKSVHYKIGAGTK